MSNKDGKQTFEPRWTGEPDALLCEGVEPPLFTDPGDAEPAGEPGAEPPEWEDAD